MTPGRNPLQPTEAAAPLSAEESALADRVAHRLHEELRSLLGHLPEHVRGGTALSRHLDLNRATCQRVVGAATDRRPDPELLTRIPGVQGLRQFLEALRGAGLEDAELDSAEAAVDQYEELLDRIGGSQSRLASRLSVTAPAAASLVREGGGDALMHHRSRLFESAAALCGRSSEVGVTLYAYRPHPEDPDRMESLTISGYLGHRSGPHAVPLVVVAGSRPMSRGPKDRRREFSSLDESPARGRTPRAVLEEFSTSPLPLVTSQGPEGLLLQTVDEKAPQAGEPMDLVFGHRPTTPSPHPRIETPPLHESWALQHYPARHLVFDVWLHRDLARICIPSVDLHLYSVNFTAFTSHRWTSRFPHGPRLEILGSGDRNAASPRYRRMVELIRHAFGQVGWPLHEFIGHRCEVAYPVWRAGYCITCDFSQEESGPAAP